MVLTAINRNTEYRWGVSDLLGLDHTWITVLGSSCCTAPGTSSVGKKLIKLVHEGKLRKTEILSL